MCDRKGYSWAFERTFNHVKGYHGCWAVATWGWADFMHQIFGENAHFMHKSLRKHVEKSTTKKSQREFSKLHESNTCNKSHTEIDERHVSHVGALIRFQDFFSYSDLSRTLWFFFCIFKSTMISQQDETWWQTKMLTSLKAPRQKLSQIFGNEKRKQTQTSCATKNTVKKELKLKQNDEQKGSKNESKSSFNLIVYSLGRF